MKLGILGGGQLGRMLALAAQPLGIRVVVIDPHCDTPARVAAEHICADYDDAQALERLAECDVVTFEFENVPDAAAQKLASKRPVFPHPEALRVAQDRLLEKTTFGQLGIHTARFLPVDSQADVEQAWQELGPLVLKTRRLGYDGKGQKVIRDPSALPGAYAELGSVPAIAEQFIPFDRELSVIVCRGRDGQSEVYPLTENQHESGILRCSIAPAERLAPGLQEQAQAWARTLVDHFEYVGVLALELFESGGQLLVNEFAPRVHNSGHWTIEGARTSQFENHVRAVVGLPLGATDALCPTGMINCIGSMPEASHVLRVPDAHYHDYGKEPREGRKVGHLTVRACDVTELHAKLQSLRALL